MSRAVANHTLSPLRRAFREAEKATMATSASPIQVPKDGTADGEILRVDHLKMYFPITQGIILQRQVGWGRAAGDPRSGARARQASAGPGAAQDCRAEPVLRQPLPARVFGWPAPAHRDSPRAGRAADLHRV